MIGLREPREASSVISRAGRDPRVASKDGFFLDA
jgi:hypothetical protein